jgi:hypothetical protein
MPNEYKARLIKELAAAGNKKAMLELARFYIDTKTAELTADKSGLILQYLTELAADETIPEDDRSFAMRLLGIMYYSGKGVEQSYRKAVEWYEKAADKADSHALCNLGYCYLLGRDITVNYEKAYLYFSQSAFAGNANAMYKLGDMFYDGNHVDEDKQAAFYWYRMAFEHGKDDKEILPSIKYRLGRCCLHGHGTAENHLAAMGFLQDSEIGLFQLHAAGDMYAAQLLPKVRAELENSRAIMYGGIGIR